MNRSAEPGTTGMAFRRTTGHGGAPVILLHAIGTDSSLWNAQWAALAGSFDLVACDLPGHGMSLPPDETPDIFDYAADVVAIMDREGIAAAHVVGLSLGGMVALALALSRPDRVRSVTAADARMDAPAEYRAMWDGLITKARDEGMDAVADFMLTRWFGEAPAGPDVEAIGRSLRGTTAAGFIAAARALQGLDFHERLAEIACPALLMVGANDGVLPARMRDMAALMRNARLVEIADAGHLSNTDRPEDFNRALMSFLEEHRETGG